RRSVGQGAGQQPVVGIPGGGGRPALRHQPGGRRPRVRGKSPVRAACQELTRGTGAGLGRGGRRRVVHPLVQAPLVYPREEVTRAGPAMLLRTEQLTKDYGRFRALDGLTLSVAAGEVFGLLGPNGSGKTTALRLILGFLRPTAGGAWVAGHDCWRDGVAA